MRNSSEIDGLGHIVRALGSARKTAPCVLALLAVAAPASGQGVRTSSIERRPLGDVVEFQVTADGSRVLYRADHEIGGRFQLFSVPADGSAPPIPLSADPVRAGFVLAANGARAVFSTDDALLSVPTDGSTAPLRLDYAATDLTPTLDGMRVAYRFNGLRLCPVDLGQPLSLAAGADSPLKMTPDGTGLVFPVNVLAYPNDEYSDLIRVPLNGNGSQVFLGGAEWVDYFPSLPSFAVGNTSVTFLANDVGTIGTQLCSSLADGSRTTLIGVGTDFVTTFDGRRVVYLDEARRLVSALTSGAGIARSANGSGSGVRGKPSVVLSATPASGNGLVFQIAPDQHHVVFRGLAAGSAHLFSVRIDGSAPAVLLSDVMNGVDDFVLTHDGSKALFTVSGSLFSVPLDLSRPALQLAAPSVPGGSVESILPDPSGARVVFTADHLTRGIFELFSVPIEGGAAEVRLNSDLPPGASLDQEPGQVVVSPDGTRVVFSGAQGTSGVFELFSVPIDGHAPPRRLSSPRPLSPYPRRVFDYQVAASGPRVVYRANAEDEGVANLYAHGPAGLVKLNGPPSFPEFAGVVTYRLSADGSRVVYGEGYGDGLHFPLDDSPVNLFGVPSDGSSAPLSLIGSGVMGYELDALGQRVVYRSLGDQLFSVPALGGSSIQLDGGHDAFVFSTTPDAASVVFSGNDPTSAAFYVVPIDASEAARRLYSFHVSPAFSSLVVAPDSERAVLELGARRLVSVKLHGAPSGTQLGPAYESAGPGSYSISADSSHVVFRADIGATGRVDLYAVPIDGSPPPVRLNASMDLDRDVTAFAISADSTRVVYRADQSTNDVFELFVVPIDGGAVPLRLNAPLPSGGDVEAFALTPDSTRAVYSADQVEDGHQELFAVALDGSSAPLLISGASSAPSQVGAFRIAASGRVHFLFDQGSGFDLLRVRVDDGGRLERESSPLVAGGNVLSFQLAVSETSVYYLADQEFDESPELYLSLLRPRDHVR